MDQAKDAHTSQQRVVLHLADVLEKIAFDSSPVVSPGVPQALTSQSTLQAGDQREVFMI